MSVFRVLKHDVQEELGIYNCASVADMGIGVGLVANSTETVSPVAADGDNFVGFLMQKVVANSSNEKLLVDVITGNRTIPAEVKVGSPVNIAMNPIEILTNQVVTTGIGALSLTTPRDTRLAFVSANKGKLRVAQEGDVASYRLVRAIAAGSDDPYVKWNVRKENAYLIRRL